jgi:hypothetical protein
MNLRSESAFERKEAGLTVDAPPVREKKIHHYTAQHSPVCDLGWAFCRSKG